LYAAAPIVTPTVIVVGSINVDLTTRVAHLPRPGETVIGGTYSRAHGGKGANQAVAAARLGARVVLVGMLGDDDLGRAARRSLQKEGVVLDEVRVGRGHTGVAQILVDDAGENLIAVASGTNDELAGTIVAESLNRLDVEDPVVLSVLEIPDDGVAAAADVAARRGWRFVLNPAPARPIGSDLVARCEVLTPNEHEAMGLGFDGPAGLLAAGAGAVVVTRSAAGAEVHRSGTPEHRQTAFPVDVVDTTGAGDAFSGALAVGLAEGRELEAAVEMASACGALATSALGARGGMPRRAELEALLAAGRRG
jgi:ribokinase